MAHAIQKVAITGVTGFVGRHILPRLVAAGYQVRALVRDPDRLPADNRIAVVAGDLFDDAALAKLLSGMDALIHLIGIIRELPGGNQTFEHVHAHGTSHLVAAANLAGVRRFIHMSALGTRPNAVSRYHQTKWQAEQAVRGSTMEWTIFRPSMIHGPDGEFMNMVKDFWCRRLPPFVPCFGGGLLGLRGGGRIQPVWVEDVARCFVDALQLPNTVGQAYDVCGPDIFTWREFYHACRRHLPAARRKPVIAIPAWLALALARLPGMPFNADQVVMSLEDSIGSADHAQADIGFEFAPLRTALAHNASQLV